ncbi:Mrp/NBP35 family ATP-binding protein [Deinococcus radiophilus]|uniref:Iron-sulfur cluster carrier protein n=1 Tax=Deinococcus radiophilus TaxID=32062 RepID=A0A431VST5_9DEIO|nr:Mrp/NBP35 family ATP-binding protein [Deinococcus radiophilus]RTR26247.1 MRP family ATP-binding protein [Deinococcus radiophilus]UFA50300.1 Mrp/NBP35 family ATP-binding protein [Deinococcus radiophilus]
MQDAVMAALSTVNDPELHQDLVSLGMIESVRVEAGVAAIKVNLTTPACPLKGTIENDVRRAVMAVDGIQDVQVTFGAQVRTTQQLPLPGVKHVILVGSGKGGVGKSNVAVNVAVSLALDGARVGLLDADVYGPSVAHMLGQAGARITANEQRHMMPIEAHGIRFISMANLTKAGQALVWRGPMLHSAIGQFLKDADWGNLDYLIIDLPPGTGDVQLSITQSVKVTGALIVTTPQDVALIDATRAVDMFHKASVPVLGVAENMSYFVAPDTGHTYDLFGRGGARGLGLDVLGEIPLDPEVRQDADAGVPAVIAHPQSVAAQTLRELSRNVAGRISVVTMSDFGVLDPLPVV